ALLAAGAAGAVDEDALADADLVARLEDDVLDRLVVDEGAVGAADVEEAVAAAIDLTELGVPPRDFGVVQADRVAGLPAGGEDGAHQVELLALVGAFDHNQTRHDSPRLRCCVLAPWTKLSWTTRVL